MEVHVCFALYTLYAQSFGLQLTWCELHSARTGFIHLKMQVGHTSTCKQNKKLMSGLKIFF